jgi:uracil-DNA glycosylase
MTAIDPGSEIAVLRERVLAAPCGDGRRPVFGAGSVTPRLFVIGEGPAERDETTGRPFSGPAGNLLTKALGEAGVSTDDVWFTNVLKCRLVVQKDGRWVNRPPKDAEIAAAMPVLDEEVRILRPPVALCLGATAAKALLGKSFNFTRDRGLWFPIMGGPHVIATYLPAYILRREGPDFDVAYEAMLTDMRAAAKGPEGA